MKRAACAGACLLFLSCSALSPHAQPADSPWPMFHFNALHTGQSLFHGTDTGALSWSYETADAIRSSPAIGSDGAVYFGSFDYMLYRITSACALSWSYETGSYIYSSPSIGTDWTLYVGSFDHAFYAFNGAGPTATNTPTITPTPSSGTPTPSAGTPTATPTPTPAPLSLSVNNTQFSNSDTIIITANLNIAGTQWAGVPCYPYVRFLTPDSADARGPAATPSYLYITRSGALVWNKKTPYITGRNGSPLAFRSSIAGYPVFSANFSNIPQGVYHLQGALVTTNCAIMGTMADIELSVQAPSPTPTTIGLPG